MIRGVRLFVASIAILAPLPLLGCAEERDVGPIWIALAERFEPRPLSADETIWAEPFTRGPTLGLQAERGGSGAWVVSRIPADAWRPFPAGGAGAWTADRPMPGLGRPRDGATAQRMSLGETELDYVPLGAAAALAASEARASIFCAAGDAVYVVLGADAEPPGDAVLREYVDRGASENGAWRVAIGHIGGHGIPLLSGLPETVTCGIPPASTLRFTTAGWSYSSKPKEPGGTVRFRVELDGKTIHEHAQEIGMFPRAEFHAVDLPAAGMGKARLSFIVEGGAALAAVLSPTIGPREIGAHGARPWEARPDLVLFVADTFRADNMAFYGGDPVITPNLDRFALESLRFEEAWSSSSWTLPSHTSLFLGLHPPQHGAVEHSLRADSSLVSIVERLSAAGYRTAAVTDSVYVSRRFGIDQGFDWFEEHGTKTMTKTLASVRGLLQRDDGRPLFLFVHSYRAHDPYEISDETRARIGEHLGVSDDWRATLERFPKARWRPNWTPPAKAQEWLRELEAVYRGGAADLDAGFEELRVELDEAGILEAGYFVFTSDHGEAFWEHDTIGHGTGVWFEHLRVPLLIHGPDLEPRVVRHPASIVDLPHTFARLADVLPASEWEGRSLLDLDTDQPIFGFQCARGRKSSSLALLDGRRKLIAPSSPDAAERGVVEHAYDLELDPLEREDLLGSSDWPTELLRGQAPALARLFERRAGPARVELSEEELERFRAMGYAGDEGGSDEE